VFVSSLIFPPGNLHAFAKASITAFGSDTSFFLFHSVAGGSPPCPAFLVHPCFIEISRLFLQRTLDIYNLCFRPCRSAIPRFHAEWSGFQYPRLTSFILFMFHHPTRFLYFFTLFSRRVIPKHPPFFFFLFSPTPQSWPLANNFHTCPFFFYSPEKL